MTTSLTPEQFLAQRDPEEPDEPDGFTAPIGDPLESIAHSLHRLTEIVVRRDAQEEAEDQDRQALDQLDAEYAELERLNGAKQQLIDDVLKICKPSTSKLANSIRALLEAPVAGQSADETAVSEQPAHDADVEEWRSYARFLGHGRTGPAFNDLEQMNRSQIRTMLGIDHSEGASA